MSEIQAIQEVQLKIFKEFQLICQKYDLKYYAIGGTCIGAIRHHGFIPWDGDIDVVMPYPDYCKFIEVAKDALTSQYELIEGNTTKHFIFNFAKVYDNTTTCIEKSVINYVDRYCGIFLDVFPIHNLPNNRYCAILFAYINHILNRMNTHARFSINECMTLKSKIIHILAFPFRLFGGYTVFSDMQNKLFTRYDKKKTTKYVIFPWRGRPSKNTLYTYKDIFYGEDFTYSKKMPFEDTTISVPNGYDRYLRMDFGDYMELPPESERKPSHSLSLISTNKSYIEYIGKI